MSKDAVLLIACGALSHELVRIRELNGWAHLDIQCLPAELHNEPHKIPDAVAAKLEQNKDQYREIVVGYADCGTGGQLDRLLEEQGIERLPGAHCYEFFAGSTTFHQLHESEPGTFYLTDFLARHFQRLVIKGLGLDRFPELKSTYFAHYKKLVLLAQLDDDSIDQAAQEAAQFLELDYERVFTGDDFLDSELAVRIGSVSKPNNQATSG